MNWDIKQYAATLFAEFLMREFPRLDCDDMQRIFRGGQDAIDWAVDMVHERDRSVAQCRARTPSKN